MLSPDHIDRRFFARIAIILVSLLLLLGCSSPSGQVASDVGALALRELGKTAAIRIVDCGPGEGDGENVYYIVDIVVVANAGITVSTGPFGGLSLKRGETSQPVRLELLYQWRGSSWRLASVLRDAR